MTLCLCSDHPGKSSPHLTPHTVTTILLTTFPVLYSTSRGFYNWHFVLLNPFPFFTHPPRPRICFLSQIFGVRNTFSHRNDDCTIVRLKLFNVD